MNFMLSDELQAVAKIIELLNDTGHGRVISRILLADSNGESLGYVEQRQSVGFVFVPDQTVTVEE